MGAWYHHQDKKESQQSTAPVVTPTRE
ncbi:hypothetical protein B5P41_31945 [Bacillus sp. SRB_28]|nr:hypothetical protein B5P41_31945 [Bacillus sp. SRB_28]